MLAAVCVMPYPAPTISNEMSSNHLELSRFKLLLSQPTQRNCPLIPQQAFVMHRSSLTTYEKVEINYHPTIYTVGQLESKMINNHIQGLFTDRDGRYMAVPGDHIAYRYNIEQLIGEGSFSQVFRCTDKRTDQTVAVKVIKQHVPAKYEESVMLLHIHELDPKGKSNCVRLLDYDHFRWHHYMVLENFEMDLAFYLKNTNKLKLTEYTLMMKSILHALDFLFRNKIIHGDLKPENILLDSGNPTNLKLADFGLSTFETRQQYRDLYQTRYYRAPEVCCKGLASTAMDMWSFACVLAEMVLGEPFLNGYTEDDQIAVIMQYFGYPPEIYFTECKYIWRYFTKDLRLPSHCYEFLAPETGYWHTEVLPDYEMMHPGRRAPGTSNLEDDFPGWQGAHLRDFLRRCFQWDPKSRIKPAFALRHPLFCHAQN